ncbi:MAG: branched-chain amino acid transaminase [Nitrososphaerales archaeon]
MVVELESRATRTTEIQKTKFVWMDGEIVGWDQATVPVMTHGLHYGTGVFEGIRGYSAGGNLNLFRMHDHFERLLGSAKILDLETKYTPEQFDEACIGLLRANDMREDCYIRPIIFVGFSGINLGFINYPVNSAIITFPFKNYFGKPGLDVCVSTWTRLYDPVTPPMGKICGNYVNSVFAKRESAKNGFDEAIMLNYAGKVSEGTGENIFIVKNRKLYTPTLGSSILDGITRNTVIFLARELGMELIERDIARSELYTADEVFFTGTAAGIAPVLTIDRRKVGTGKVGPITERLFETYSALVLGKTTFGRDEWVTKIY